MALTHMGSRGATGQVKAKELSEHFGISPALTAKVLQKLKSAGLIESSQGALGGYRMSSNLSQISLDELIHIMEGDRAIVDCLSHGCAHQKTCSVKFGMSKVNQRVRALMKTISISSLMHPAGETT
jgi:Rrf2 family protein